MTAEERKQAWWLIFLNRKPLDPAPKDLAPVWSLVRTPSGHLTEIIHWFAADPNEDSGCLANKRMAYVLNVEGPGAGELHGLVPEDMIQFVCTQERPRYIPQFMGVLQ